MPVISDFVHFLCNSTRIRLYIYKKKSYNINVQQNSTGCPATTLSHFIDILRNEICFQIKGRRIRKKVCLAPPEQKQNY